MPRRDFVAPGDRGGGPASQRAAWDALLGRRAVGNRTTRKERLGAEIGLLWGPEGPSKTTLVLAAVGAPTGAPAVLEVTASAWGTAPGWQTASVRYVSFPAAPAPGKVSGSCVVSWVVT